MNLERIQEAIRDAKIDAWLFFDHHQRDPLAYQILGLDATMHASRRWYYMIPANGEPRGLVHRIEATNLDQLPGKMETYASWDTQTAGISGLLAGVRRVAMQYSPFCAIPYVSLVDAGTIELIRSGGVEVVSSANLVQLFEAQWTAEQFGSHVTAGRLVDQIRKEAFERIAEALRAQRAVSEYEVQQFILGRFASCGMVTDHPPIVAVNANASNPHYCPAPEGSREISRGDSVLIDLWAKTDAPRSVFYDVTWMGFCGSIVPDPIQNVFGVVSNARDAAVAAVKSAKTRGVEIRGYELDDVCRGHIRDAGFGEFFVHRTGHSIGTNVHGNGANIDNLETHDDRLIISNTCFSVEPGVYLAEFGVRSEVNVFVRPEDAITTGEVQDRIVSIV